VKVNPTANDTAEIFSARYNLSVGRLRSLNAVDPARAALEAAADGPMAEGTELEIGGKPYPYSFESSPAIDAAFLQKLGTDLPTLKTLNDRIVGALNVAMKARQKMLLNQAGVTLLLIPDGAKPQDDEAEQVAPPAVDANPDFDWLVYETRVNAKDYQKEKTPAAYGLYAVPIDSRAEIVASQTLPDALVNGFFPGLTKEEVLAISAQSCRWRKSGGARPTGDGPNSATTQGAARSELALHAPRMMVMPYNYFANDQASHAIGADVAQEITPGPAFRLKKFWPLWETASRSSVSVIEPISPDDLQPAARLDAPWDFRKRTPPAGATMAGTYRDKVFKLAEQRDAFSVKTGVRWLGAVPQGSDDPGGGKDVLESNALLASMRSDWSEHVEATIGPSTILIVLRELLTVTFPNRPREKRDGYQVRDLSPLDKTKLYFPPLSIPFGGQAFVDAYNSKNGGKPKVSAADFWKRAYAEPVGRAKAELLLRYGLQLTTPNPQNFLLEFDKATLEPTGRVVVRDIGDAKLHSEFIAQMAVDHPALQYELKPHVEGDGRPGYLPAQTNNQGRVDDHARHERFDQYPLNTRIHWHQYSTFKDKYGGVYLPEQMMTTIDWGRAHYAAYLDWLATKLEAPALKLNIWDQAAYDRVLAANEAQPNTSKGEAAKKALPKARTRAGGDVRMITPDIWRQLITAKECTITDAINSEWALELHTDEVLHSLLSTSATLAKVKAKWKR
jgi:hypothetical protein